MLLFGVTLWLQSPAISGAVALADAGLAELHGLRQADFRRESLTIAAIQLGLVAVVFVISTLRPWGRVVRRWNVSRRVVLGLVGVSCCSGLAMAVMVNVNLHRLRTLPIPAAAPSRVADGTHRGEAPCDIPYAVDVRVADGRMTAIDVRRNRTSHYARLAEAVTQRIVERQSPEVDAITGATTTSRCLMRAVAESLRSAERRPTAQP